MTFLINISSNVLVHNRNGTKHQLLAYFCGISKIGGTYIGQIIGIFSLYIDVLCTVLTHPIYDIILARVVSNGSV